MKKIYLLLAMLLSVQLGFAQYYTPAGFSIGSDTGAVETNDGLYHYTFGGIIQTTSTYTGSSIVATGLEQPETNHILLELPSYEIEHIPDQDVNAGSIIKFFVTCSLYGDSSQFAIQPNDSLIGVIEINQLGLFTYQHVEEDYNDFSVDFIVSHNGDTLTQTVEFIVFPDLTPEVATFGLDIEIPIDNEDSKDFVVINDILGETQEMFNNAMRYTRNIDIAGKTLIIADGHENNVYLYNQNEDIKNFNLYAETVIIRSPLHIPGANINICAKKLVFEDSTMTNPTYIQTTPSDYSISTQGAGGAGQDAGNITLNVRDYEMDYALRFKLIGGSGQSSNGGMPGNGGNGGILSATEDVEMFCDYVGGSAGVQISSANSYGTRGQDGSCLLINDEYSWLHPFYVQMVLKHIKSIYQYDNFAYVMMTSAHYDNDIYNFKATPEFALLDNELQIDLLQQQQQFNLLMNQVVNCQDYYGYPLGWVPMLSFEANLIAYQNEIDHAIRTMYLAYWINNEATSIAEKSAALTSSRNQLKGELNNLYTRYEDVSTELPTLVSQANEMVQYNTDLAAKAQEIHEMMLEKAEHITNENLKQKAVEEYNQKVELIKQKYKEEPGFWGSQVGKVKLDNLLNKGVNYIDESLGITNKIKKWAPSWVKDMVPGLAATTLGNLVAPGIGFLAGKLTSWVSGWFKPKMPVIPPLNVEDIPQLHTEFQQGDYQNISDSIDASLSVMNFNNIDFSANAQLSEYQNKISSWCDTLTLGIEHLRVTFGNMEVPIDEINTELQELKASTPEYKEVVEQISGLMERKRAFQEHMNSVINNLTAYTNEMQQSILQVDAMNRGIIEGNNIVDMRALMALKGMEQNARNRLEKYHYFMAKSYEYRMLEAYNEQFNAQDLFDAFQLIAASASDHNLTSTDYQNLKAVYEDEISVIIAEIHTELNNNPPELSVPIHFNLTEDELAILNSNNELTFNMVEKGLFPANEENIRIVNFNIYWAGMHLESGSLGTFAYTDLKFEHDGESKLKSKGEFYYFQHNRNELSNPISWGSRLDAIDGLINPFQPSAASQSLLLTLLSHASLPTSSGELLLYSRPAAWADITLTKSDNSSSGANLIIDSLRIELQYDFFDRPTNLRNLDITINDPKALPYIQLSHEDINQRKDGRGNIHRTFNVNNSLTVTVTAEEIYGKYLFEKWTDRYGNNLIPPVTTPSISINTMQDKAIMANYILIKPILHVPQDTILLPGFAGTSSFDITNIGLGEMDWVVSNSTPWISFADSTGMNDTIFTFDYSANPSYLTERTAIIYVYAPESEDYADTIYIKQTLGTSIGLTISDEISCAGGTGSLDLTVQGGLTPFTYLWSNGAISQDLNNVVAGIYSVTITDGALNATQQSIELIEPSMIAITETLSNFSGYNISCNGASDGSIVLSSIGGTPPYSYNWSNGSAANSNSGLNAGTYTVTLTDMHGCTKIESYQISEPVQLSLTFTKVDVSTTGGNDGSIDVTVSGGVVSYSYLWSNGATMEDLSTLPAGTYSLTVTDWNSCLYVESFEISEPGTTGTPDWQFMITGSSHTILAQTTAAITIDGAPISSGDYLGVFYDSLGTLVCGGFVDWNGINTAVTAWGADVGNDGFATGETFKWKIWRASDGQEFDASATYIPAPVMPNQGQFVANGLSGLVSLTALTVEYQYIDLPNGWSFFSTYIDPFEANIDSILSDIVADVIICKDGTGGTYWPQYGVNLIGDILIGDGYQIKMNTAQTLVIEGLAVQPQSTPVVVPQGWSFLGYLGQTPASIVTMLSPIVSEVIIVKNGTGGTYWPLYGVNLIGNMNPGEGYQIKMNSQQTLTYPANTAASSKSNITLETANYFTPAQNTGNNMTLGIPLSAWETMPVYGDEVGVYSESGILIGSGVYIGGNMAISLWGDDELTAEPDGLSTGERFNVRLWNGEEHSLEIESWLEGAGSYEANKIAVVGQLTQNSELRTFQLYQNTPNPFSHSTEFSFYLPETTEVEFTILNVLGEVVEVLTKEELAQGKHTLRYETTNLESGTYYYNLRTPEFSDTKKMVIIE